MTAHAAKKQKVFAIDKEAALPPLCLLGGIRADF